MMASVLSFVLYVTALSVLSTLVELLLPSGSMRESAKTGIGMVLLSAIVGQILSIIVGRGI